MIPVGEYVPQIAEATALKARTKAERKSRIVDLALAGVMAPSRAHWLIVMNGLRAE